MFNSDNVAQLNSCRSTETADFDHHWCLKFNETLQLLYQQPSSGLQQLKRNIKFRDTIAMPGWHCDKESIAQIHNKLKKLKHAKKLHKIYCGHFSVPVTVRIPNHSAKVYLKTAIVSLSDESYAQQHSSHRHISLTK